MSDPYPQPVVHVHACREPLRPYRSSWPLPPGPAFRNGRRAPVHPPPDGEPQARTLPVRAHPAERSIREADGLAMALHAATARVAVPLGRAAAAFCGARGWAAIGYARLEDHCRERLGRSGRWLRETARLGRAVERLPAIGSALRGDDGNPPLGVVAALLIGRVADASSVDAWIERARGMSVRRLRIAVGAAEAGATGSDPQDLAPEESEPAGESIEQAGVRATSRQPGDDRRPAASGAALPATAREPDGGDDERSLVRFLGPAQLRGAFDESLDLHRSVEGHESTVTAFLEALIGEAASAGCPPDAHSRPLRHGTRRGVVEGALERSTGGWSHLPAAVDGSWALALARATLGRLEELEAVAGAGGPAALEDQMRSLLDLQDDLDRRLSGLLCDMGARGAWSRLRFAGVGHYAVERLGMSRTAAEDRVRLAHALDRLPRLREAFEAGRVSFEAARCVARILRDAPADDAAERSWVERAREATVKRLRDEERALSRRAVRRPAPLDDASWHASLQRAPGTARGRVLRLAMGAAVDPGPDVFLRFRLPADLADDLLAAVESARAALSGCVDAVPWDQPWPDPAPLGSVVAARTFSVRGRRVPGWVGLLALLEEFVLTWDPPRTGRRPRQPLHERDGWRCMAPGCTSRRHLEDHHVVYRARGGADTLLNRVSLCRFHHQRGEHGTLLQVRGIAPLGLRWRLGRPELGERFRNERRRAAG